MASNQQHSVGIVMGSATDAEVMKKTAQVLEDFGVSVEIRVFSAHRTPSEAIEWAESAEKRGHQVLIAAAGLAAHLAGVVAANTALPVIGVPMAGGPLAGFDSLLSTVQMPKGTPVATVAVGSAGATNAALLALRILGVGDSAIRDKVKAHKEQIRQESLAADKGLQN